MKQELVNIGIQDFLKLSFLVDESNIGQDFIIGEANGSAAFRDSRLLEALHYPVRYDGYILFFVKKGHFVVNCNLNSFDVEEHSLLVTVPGNIWKFRCKVTPCVPSQTDPLVRLKMTPWS